MSKNKRSAKRFDKLGTAASDVVMQAASVLEEELAIGIDAAKKAEERFRKERQFDSQDVTALIERFRSDGHDIIEMAGSRLEMLKTEETGELAQRLLNDAHQLVDLAAHVGAQLPDVLNRLLTLVPKSKPKDAPNSPQ